MTTTSTTDDSATILLVDDQERNLDALEAILDSTGYGLVRARSADEALLALLKGEFAAIVCDIKMPGIGGIELAQIIKQRKRTQHIPILFLTAHAPEPDEVLRGYNVGAVDYLSKPINPEILRLKLGVFVELFRTTRALAQANQALADEVAERKRAQDALRVAKEDLEVRVQERTAELTAANRALRESDARMALAMRAAAMGVFSQDLRSGRLLWSKAMEAMFGLPPDGFEGTLDDFLRRVHPDDRKQVRASIEAAAEGGDAFSFEHRFFRDGDAAERWMSAAGQFVRDEDGRPVHGVGVCTDITARRLAADELHALKEAAEAANRAKDHFLAVLSHELRTPLTPVLATVQELLRDGAVPPDLRESLDLVHRNVELEARLIDDLLDLTRIARGKMELHRSTVDVHQVLSHALTTCDADFRGKQIHVHTGLAATSFHVDGDRGRLLQVFWNLLKNAAKFTPAGQSVHVRTWDSGADGGPAGGARLHVEVRDTGIGIEPSRLGRIFDAFDQGGPDVTRQYGGLGLGLSIGKALVDLHGGTITATSPGLGDGAAFTVSLPLTAADVQSPAPAADRPSPATADATNGSRAADPRPGPAGGSRLLLVEDHPDTSRVMAKLLRAAGYDVTTAESVASALRAIAAAPRRFDVVVSDIGLPDGSGLDLMRQIRVRFPGLPAIALSGFGMEEDRLRSREAGFVAHLTKPLDFTRLRAAVDRVLSSARPHADLEIQAAAPPEPAPGSN